MKEKIEMPPFNAMTSRQCRSAMRCFTRNVLAAAIYALIFLSLILVPWHPVRLSAFPERSAASDRPGSLTGIEQVVHVLNRLTYGPRPDDIERAEKMGLKKFIEQQLHPESLPDPLVEQKLADLDTLRMTSSELALAYPPPQVAKRLQERQGEAMGRPKDPSSGEMMPRESPSETSSAPFPRLNPGRPDAASTEMSRNPNMKFEGPREIVKELQQAKVLRAVYSERQLYEEMVDFWENHFNIFAGKGADRWLLTEYDREVIRPNALGKFKDLVEATAHSSAMLFYLDNWLSADPNGPHPNANRGRNRPFGNRRYNLGGRPIPPSRNPVGRQAKTPPNANPKRGLNENYARELMELHTLGVEGGYTQKDVTEVARCFTGWTIRQPRQGGEFFFNERIHDNGPKLVLGHKIHAGGEKDGEEVINLLVHHPSTAHFIAQKLVTRFVSDAPPESLVGRVAATYMKTDGDIREMLRTIFYSPEFNSKDAYRAKVKSPFELVVSAIRTSGGDTDASVPLLQFVARMGQPLFMYQAPTGYPDRASEWLNTGTLLTRMNFALAFAANRIAGTNIELARLLGEDSPTQPDEIRSRLLQRYLLGDASGQTRAALNAGLRGPGNDDGIPSAASASQAVAGRALPVEIAGLILGSPEFQRR
ncbi:MAG: DUF1800 domain-containing protein [Acidobacteriia bacterium]|nr:DUF1800 domain-containing protein [Terriglobia bacterium]